MAFDGTWRPQLNLLDGPTRQIVQSLQTYLGVNHPITICTSTTRPTNPQRGWTIFETDTGNVFVYYGTTTGWQPPWSVAWGFVASATGTVTGPTIGTTDTLINGTAITFTTVGARRYRASLSGLCQSSSTADVMTFHIQRNSANVSSQWNTHISIVSVDIGFICEATLAEGSAGSVTYRGVAARPVGAGTDKVEAGAVLYIEDIGPSGNAPSA